MRRTEDDDFQTVSFLTNRKWWERQKELARQSNLSATSYIIRALDNMESNKIQLEMIEKLDVLIKRVNELDEKVNKELNVTYTSIGNKVDQVTAQLSSINAGISTITNTLIKQIFPSN